MSFIFKRPINYYETDRMGVVHHSNYIRYMEEARTAWLQDINMPFSLLEENNITIPVLGVSCDYKHHVTFGDTIIINLSIKYYNGVRMTVSYDMKDMKSGETVLTGETRHCFTNKDLRPINLKKFNQEFSDNFANLVEENPPE